MRTLDGIVELLRSAEDYSVGLSKYSYGDCYYSIKYRVDGTEVSITGKTIDEIWERLERATMRGVAIPQLINMSEDDDAQYEHKKIVDEGSF